MNIYITQGGKQLGPYTVDQVKAMLGTGAATLTDFAWYEGLPNWVPLAQVPGMTVIGASPEGQGWPVMVWVISIFCIVRVAFSSLGLIFLWFAAGLQTTNSPGEHYLATMTPIDYLLPLITVGVNLGLGVSLLMLRRQAIYWSFGYLVLSLINYAHQLFFRPGFHAMGSLPLLIGTFIGITINLVINVGIIAYTWRIYRTRILR